MSSATGEYAHALGVGTIAAQAGPANDLLRRGKWGKRRRPVMADGSGKVGKKPGSQAEYQ